MELTVKTCDRCGNFFDREQAELGAVASLKARLCDDCIEIVETTYSARSNDRKEGGG
jgi:hypothetical protein